MNRLLKPLLCCLLPLALVACKTKLPEGIIDASRMENILYDYHVARAMASVSADSVDYRMRLYCAAVYKKYGISEADFNRSLEWYTRHSDELFEIYERLDERFAKEASALGLSAGPGSELAKVGAQGDTANVWRGRSFYLLSSNYINRMSFTQKADTAYRPGDRIEWHFNVRWVYREGYKAAKAVLAVRYDNDSTATVVQHIYNSGVQSVAIKTGKRKIKEVSGLIYQNAEWSDKPKLMLISNPALVRFHEKAPASAADSLATSAAHADSLTADTTAASAPDSLRRPHGNMSGTPQAGERTFTLRRRP